MKCKICNQETHVNDINYLTLSIHFNGIPTGLIVLKVCENCRHKAYKDKSLKVTIKNMLLE